MGITATKSVSVRVGRSREPCELGPRVSEGGQAEVFRLGKWQAAKLYHKGFSEKSWKELQLRLAAIRGLQQACPSDLALNIVWPGEEVETADGLRHGFTMRFCPASYALQDGITQLKAGGAGVVGMQKRLMVAVQIAQVFRFFHSREALIGDPSANNFLVSECIDRLLVQLIDVDSIVPKGFVGGYRTPRYMLPEEARNRGGTLPPSTKRTDEHALAFLVFEVLMRGVSPYAHVGGGSPSENVAKARFPYCKSGTPQPEMPSRFAPFWSDVPPNVRAALQRSLGRRDYLSAGEWCAELNAALVPNRIMARPRPRLSQPRSVPHYPTLRGSQRA